ncbi:MAG: sel1 repeat family protein, partial [Rhizobium sp.]|nr:sel1 repeat family protein [Rhizobium sp.]
MLIELCWQRAIAALIVGIVGWIALTGPLAAQEQSGPAAAALEKCDKLASMPGDPNIVAPAVPDSQFAPGAAIPACEEAVRMNPDLARARFELGRSYWIGQRDAEALKAFGEAAKHCYPPAKKFIGDAYLEGRGLPTGEQRDIQRAIEWYKDAATATPECRPGYRDAERARLEAQALVDRERNEREKREAEAAKARFDAAAFQRGDYLTYIYSLSKIPPKEMELFRIYVHGFVMELGGDQILFVDSKCKPLVPSRTAVIVRDSMWSMFAIQPRAGMAHGNYQGWLNSTQFDVFTQGQRDAVELVNRYSCQSEVARKLVENITQTYHAKHIDSIIIGLTRYLPWDGTSPCARQYEAWKELNPYGAFTAGCDFSDDEADLETAKRKAVAACRSDPLCNNLAIVAVSVAAAPKIATPPTDAVLSKVTSKSTAITGGCRDRFEEWKKKPANGAFAVGKERCGFSNQADTIEHAKREALDRCVDGDCIVIYQISAAHDDPLAQSVTPGSPSTVSHATVVPEQLNLHSAPSSDAGTVVGKLARGQSVSITGPGEGDFIAIEGTCIDGKPCKGYVNGRAEFISR